MIITTEGLGVEVKQTGQESPVLTAILAGAIVIMIGTLIGTRRGSSARTQMAEIQVLGSRR